MEMTKKKLFKAAWQLARLKDITFSEALKKYWAEYKKTERIKTPLEKMKALETPKLIRFIANDIHHNSLYYGTHFNRISGLIEGFAVKILVTMADFYMEGDLCVKQLSEKQSLVLAEAIVSQKLVKTFYNIK